MGSIAVFRGLGRRIWRSSIPSAFSCSLMARKSGYGVRLRSPEPDAKMAAIRSSLSLSSIGVSPKAAAFGRWRMTIRGRRRFVVIASALSA